VTASGERHVVFGSGPVGQAIVDAFLAQDKRVRVASRSGARRALPEAVEVVRGGATDPEDTRRTSPSRWSASASSGRSSPASGCGSSPIRMCPTA
jgi:nucleoside-diphosphate-sugar epimerase